MLGGEGKDKTENVGKGKIELKMLGGEDKTDNVVGGRGLKWKPLGLYNSILFIYISGCAGAPFGLPHF